MVYVFEALSVLIGCGLALGLGAVLVRIGWAALGVGIGLLRPLRRPQTARRAPVPAREPRCRHVAAPEPVYVENKVIGGNPELVRWLCPLCLDTVPGPISPQPPCDHVGHDRERVTSFDGSWSREFCTGCGSETSSVRTFVHHR